MLEYENTYEVIKAWSDAIVTNAKINIGDRNRKRKSKITGKTRRGKIDNTGNLRNSFESDVVVNKNSFGFKISAADYAQDVNDGAKRKTTFAEAKRWAKSSKIQFRDANGKILKKTEGRIDNLAKFTAWKVSTIGSDKTNYLTEAIEDASLKYQKELAPSLFKDVQAAINAAFRNID